MQLNHIFMPAALCAMFMAVSCSSDGPASDCPEAGAGAALSFSVNTGGARGRAITSDVAVEGGQFAVWGEYVPAETPGQAPVNVFEATTVTYSGSSWGYDDTQYWLPGQFYTFVAIHPASASSAARYVGGLKLEIDDYDVTARPGVDLMTAEATRECFDIESMAPVALKFNHQLARINFVAKVNPSVTRQVVITEAMVYGVPASGSWDGSKWTLAQSSMTTDAAPLAGIAGQVEVDRNNEGQLFPDASPMLAIPQAVPYDAIFKMTYHYADDASATPYTYTYRLQIASTSLVNGWEAGRSYKYTFELGSEDFILFSKPEVTAWEEADGSNIIIQGDQIN